MCNTYNKKETLYFIKNSLRVIIIYAIKAKPEYIDDAGNYNTKKNGRKDGIIFPWNQLKIA